MNINGSTIEFFGPEETATGFGESLDFGEFVVVAVVLAGGSGIRTFTAHWTTSVPEPASLTLLGTGLVAPYAVRRRRR